jgi:malate synthase
MNTTLTESTSTSGIVQLKGKFNPGFDRVLTPEALDFVAGLHDAFYARRFGLLELQCPIVFRTGAWKSPDLSIVK